MDYLTRGVETSDLTMEEEGDRFLGAHFRMREEFRV